MNVTSRWLQAFPRCLFKFFPCCLHGVRAVAFTLVAFDARILKLAVVGAQSIVVHELQRPLALRLRSQQWASKRSPLADSGERSFGRGLPSICWRTCYCKGCFLLAAVILATFAKFVIAVSHYFRCLCGSARVSRLLRAVGGLLHGSEKRSDKFLSLPCKLHSPMA